MFLTESSIFRILRDLLSEMLRLDQIPGGASRNQTSWDFNTSLDAETVGADSLDLTNIASAVNQLFQIHEIGTEDFLLRYRTLGDWTSLVKEAIQEGTSGVSFRTSGTTGPPKLIFHSWEYLQAETEELKEIFSGIDRVLALAPAHHIYGFFYTVALPARLDVRVVETRQAWEHVHSDLHENDLIVSFPERWKYIASTRKTFPEKVLGVSSTAPLEKEIYKTLLNQGLDSLIEVYGSTETGGVGYRTHPDSNFNLMGHWQKGEGDLLKPAEAKHKREWIHPMDYLHWKGDREFFPTGRKDSAIQVGGTNVDPEKVANVLREHEWVADAVVWKMQPEEGNRLKAYIVLYNQAPNENEARESLHKWIEKNLETPSRPKSLSFGPRVGQAQ